MLYKRKLEDWVIPISYCFSIWLDVINYATTSKEARGTVTTVNLKLTNYITKGARLEQPVMGIDISSVKGSNHLSSQMVHPAAKRLNRLSPDVRRKKPAR